MSVYEQLLNGLDILNKSKKFRISAIKSNDKQYFFYIVFTAFEGNILGYNCCYLYNPRALLSNRHVSKVVDQTSGFKRGSYISIMILLDRMDVENIIIILIIIKITKLLSKEDEKENIKQDLSLQKFCNK